MYTFYFAMLADCQLQQGEWRSDERPLEEKARAVPIPLEAPRTAEGRLHEQTEVPSN